MPKPKLSRREKPKPKKAKAATKKVAVRPPRSVVLKKPRRVSRVPAGRKSAKPHQLERHENNPIIEPREGKFWEMKATFNPAALYADGRIHLLYRAIGGDDMSVLGYAASGDGINVTERPTEPAYEHRMTKKKKEDASAPVAVPAPAYSSGGGWNGGSEDPRITLIDEDGRAYLTYTAFDGWGSVRIALSSISVDDFLHKRWNWTEPVLLSPPGEIHKNWVLFPEKINGKYAILHSISPQVLIDYIDDLAVFDDGSSAIKSHYDRYSMTGSWDSWVRGVGPPPIKTKLGWLVLYHAMDIRDPNRYKLGAMILDANEPTKVLYRSQEPVLEPEEWYENNGWKSGVVYSCGAVVKDGELYVYYGGADSVVCVATANLDVFLRELKEHGVPRIVKKGTAKSFHARL